MPFSPGTISLLWCVYQGQLSKMVLEQVGLTPTLFDFLNDKVVILVDDGAATGATIIVAVRSISKRFRPKRLIIALPVTPKDIVKLLKNEADLVEVVTSHKNIRL
jgi:predicted phosphoribosyltransferase